MGILHTTRHTALGCRLSKARVYWLILSQTLKCWNNNSDLPPPPFELGKTVRIVRLAIVILTLVFESSGQIFYFLFLFLPPPQPFWHEPWKYMGKYLSINHGLICIFTSRWYMGKYLSIYHGLICIFTSRWIYLYLFTTSVKHLDVNPLHSRISFSNAFFSTMSWLHSFKNILKVFLI